MNNPSTSLRTSEHRLRPTPNPWDPNTWLEMALDPMQKKAAYLEPGPELILGGVGTGKTHTLLGRAAHLVRSGIDAGEIAIITSNAWTAQDARVRLLSVIGRDPAEVDLYVGTLHDFCLSRLLRIHAVSIPTLPKNFSVWTPGQCLAALAQIVKADCPDQTGRMGYADLAQILDWISMNAESSTEHWTPPPRDQWNAYAAAYRHEKQAQDSLDLTDLLVATRDALSENESLQYACAWSLTRHLLVDNFEDVSSLQYSLIQLMIGPEKSVCVAMDPNQRVRRWGSVLPNTYECFTTDYAKTTVLRLQINHRTSRSIMQSWRKLAQHNKMIGLEDDSQQSLRPERMRPKMIAVEGTPQDQYRRIASDIKGLVDARTFGADDIAILARRRTSLLRIGPHLEAVGIPFTTIGDFAGTSEPEVQPVLGMLTLAVNPKNVWAFRKAGSHTSNRSHRNLNPRIVREVRSIARHFDNDLIKAAAQFRTNLPPNSTAHEELSRIIELYEELRHMMATAGTRVAATLELVHRQLHRAGADRESPPPSDGMRRLMTWAKYIDETTATGSTFPNDDATNDVRSAPLNFLYKMANGTDIDRLSSAGGETPPGRGVSLATMDTSKGMEWPAVIVADVADHIVPGDHTNDGDAFMAVEQRLFYSAVTRAANWYALYWSGQRADGNDAAPCRFIKLMLE